jgi:VanZ family protein
MTPEIYKEKIFHPQIDSIGHFIGFFILTWFVYASLKLPLTTLAITLIFYAAASELGQAYLGFRNGEFYDFFADVLGIISFMIIKWFMIIVRNR